MLISGDSSFLAVVGLMGAAHSHGILAALVQSILLPVLGEISSLFGRWVLRVRGGWSIPYQLGTHCLQVPVRLI